MDSPPKRAQTRAMGRTLRAHLFQILVDWVQRRRSARLRWGVAALAFAVALLLRLWVDDILPPGFPYLTFFPAVILTSFIAGAGPGLGCALACGLAAWYFFIAPQYSFALSPASFTALAFYAFIVLTDIAIISLMEKAMRKLALEQARSHELAHARKLMFHELQHRVSNNLTAVASLLKLQRRKVADPAARRALDDSVARIAMVARMQRMLHDPNQQQVDLSRFLRDMSRDLLQTAGGEGRITCAITAEPLVIGAAQAVPLGLIATEFLANAIEHGFGHDRSGLLSIRLTRAPAPGLPAGHGDAGALLEVQDDGPGLPPGFRLEEAPSLGLQIARQFAQQLEAEISLQPAPGGGALSRLWFRPDMADLCPEDTAQAA